MDFEVAAMLGPLVDIVVAPVVRGDIFCFDFGLACVKKEGAVVDIRLAGTVEVLVAGRIVGCDLEIWVLPAGACVGYVIGALTTLGPPVDTIGGMGCMEAVRPGGSCCGGMPGCIVWGFVCMGRPWGENMSCDAACPSWGAWVLINICPFCMKA